MWQWLLSARHNTRVPAFVLSCPREAGITVELSELQRMNEILAYGQNRDPERTFMFGVDVDLLDTDCLQPHAAKCTGILTRVSIPSLGCFSPPPLPRLLLLVRQSWSAFGPRTYRGLWFWILLVLKRTHSFVHLYCRPSSISVDIAVRSCLPNWLPLVPYFMLRFIRITLIALGIVMVLSFFVLHPFYFGVYAVCSTCNHKFTSTARGGYSVNRK